MSRQIVLDTETTGLEWRSGHRIIEIGAVELQDRKLTGRHYHQYINPEREIDAAAEEIHGISLASLQDKPVFAAIAEEFLEFIADSELIIHNAPFDVGFLDNEFKLSRLKHTIDSQCSVLDTLVMARAKHPGQKINLDALCKRYGVDNSQRVVHGALMDAEILADVYLVMSGGQTSLGLGADSSASDASNSNSIVRIDDRRPGRVIAANNVELEQHQQCLQQIDKQADDGALWLQLET